MYSDKSKIQRKAAKKSFELQGRKKSFVIFQIYLLFSCSRT